MWWSVQVLSGGRVGMARGYVWQELVDVEAIHVQMETETLRAAVRTAITDKYLTRQNA